MRLFTRPVNRSRALALRIALTVSLTVTTLGLASPASADLDVALVTANGLTGLTAVVEADGDGVNMRAEPNATAEVVTTLSDGTIVALRVDVADTSVDSEGRRWWPVLSDGVEGWIAGDFLVSSDQPAPVESTDDTSDGDTAPGVTPDFSEGDYVQVVSEDGLAMRAGPSTSEDGIAALGDGDVVQVMDGPFWDEAGDGWYLITDGNISAYVFGAYLALDSAVDDGAGEPAPSVAFAVGEFVAPAAGTGGVNVRRNSSVNSNKIGSISEGVSVKVVGGPAYDNAGDAWYVVDTGDDKGYVLGSLLVAGEEAIPEKTAGPTGGFRYPLDSYVFTQAFGCTPYDFEPYDANLGCPFHNGIDLAAPAYTPLLAADGGTVVTAGWCDCGLGFYVEIDHGNGFSTVYGHMAEQPYVVAGQVVNQGDVIGPLGSTGFSTGPHVHFMIKLNGVAVDPLGYL